MRDTNYLKAKAQKCEAIPLEGNQYRVFSPSGQNYIVRLNQTGTDDHCECQFHSYKGHTCSHIIAAHSHLEELAGRKVSVWERMSDAKRQRRPRIITGDLTLTSRQTPKTDKFGKSATWLEVLMVKNLKSSSQELNRAYKSGSTVYLRYTGQPEENWIIFSGAWTVQHLELPTDTARNLIQVKRIDGQAIKAALQKQIEAQFQMSL